jgi:hypothetical protein
MASWRSICIDSTPTNQAGQAKSGLFSGLSLLGFCSAPSMVRSLRTESDHRLRLTLPCGGAGSLPTDSPDSRATIFSGNPPDRQQSPHPGDHHDEGASIDAKTRRSTGCCGRSARRVPLPPQGDPCCLATTSSPSTRGFGLSGEGDPGRYRDTPSSHHRRPTLWGSLRGRRLSPSDLPSFASVSAAPPPCTSPRSECDTPV